MLNRIQILIIFLIAALTFCNNGYGQNEEAHSILSDYNPKPKSGLEIGVHVGHFFIDGDVDRLLPAGYGLGLHLRKSLNYTFSIRGDFFYGSTKGLDPMSWNANQATIGTTGSILNQGGGLVESTFDSYRNTNEVWFPSHQTRYIYGAIQGIFNIGNILFHKHRNKWNWYLALGVGLDNNSTKLDLLNEDGIPYSDLLNKTAWSAEKFDTKQGRSEIKNAINEIYDGVYETEGFKKAGIFRLGDETNIHVLWTGSMGLARKLNNRVNIAIEHQVMASDNDYLDGIKFRTAIDQTNNVDIGHYTNLRIAINIGSSSSGIEPLYWMNPLDQAFEEIAQLKQRPSVDFVDSDQDGVFDFLDLEADSPEGCRVDTKGRSLDSDGDGIIDCKDQEIFSPSGYEINNNGEALTPIYLERSQLTQILDSREAELRSTLLSYKEDLDCTMWFIPNIYFASDSYRITSENHEVLHHIAFILNACPSSCIVITGHTDSRNSDGYNQILSEKRALAARDYLITNYGLARDRFKVAYKGEDKLLAPDINDYNYLNRRVSFSICDQEGVMKIPYPPSNDIIDLKNKTQFSGNKNSGY